MNMNLNEQKKSYVRGILKDKIVMGLAGLALSSMLWYSFASGRSKLEDSTPKSNEIETIYSDVKGANLASLSTESDVTNPILQQMTLEDIFTYKVYDDKFSSIRGADDTIAKELYQYTLEDLVKMKAISVSNVHQKDLWLPLGLNSGKIDFYIGMRDCWDDKLQRFASKLWKEQKYKLIEERNESLDKMHKKQTKSSLRNYRKGEIATGIDMLKELSDNYLEKNYTKGSVKDIEMRRLISNVEKNLSANVLLGYNIHEMLPPSLGKDRMNAVAKTYFVDRLFSEGGKEFIERYPARYDILLSYGPFQLTKYAIGEIKNKNMNSYVSKKYQTPQAMAELRNLQDHVNAAVKFAFANWITMGETLAKNNALKKFNDGFEKMDARGQQILLAGITACMHHLPAETRSSVVRYVNSKPMNNMYHNLLGSLSPQLNKYYRSSAEAYLVMKVFDKLDDKYGK